MEDHVNAEITEKRRDERPIADLAVDELMSCVALDTSQVLEVARVRQFVESDDVNIGEAAEHIPHDAEPMKPAPPVTSSFI